METLLDSTVMNDPFTSVSEWQSKLKLLDLTAIVSETDLKGNITYVNDLFCEISQFTREELIGKPHNIVRHPDMPSEAFKDLWATIGKGNVWQGIVKNKKKDGSPYWVIATVTPVLGENGKPKKYISARIDITAEKLQEIELEKQRQKLTAELVENIEYATSIQDAVMPNVQDISRVFRDGFYLNTERNLLSGKFFWLHEKRNKRMLAVGESTGRGVSASFISLILLNALRNYVADKGYADPATLLEEIDNEFKRVVKTRTRKANDTSALAFANFDFSRMRMHYAAAQCQILLVRDGLVETLPMDSSVVGSYEQHYFVLDNHTLTIKPGDCIYFTTSQIEELQKRESTFSQTVMQTLLEINALDMKSQKAILESKLADLHCGNEGCFFIGLRV